MNICCTKITRVFLLLGMAAFGHSAVLAQAIDSAPSAVSPQGEKISAGLVKKNDWNVRINNKDSNQGMIYVAIKDMGDHWEVEKFYDKLPKILKSTKLEVFSVNRKLNSWKNAHNDMVSDCGEIKTKYYTVCSSSLADRKAGAALVGALFFGGSGTVLHGYVDDKVKEAINSIPPEQAQSKLSEFIAWEIEQSGIEADRIAAIKLEEGRIKETKRLEEEKNRQLRAAAKLGTRDFCEQNVRYYDIAPGMPQGWQVLDTYNCFAFGELTLAMLKAEGWTITNRTAKVIGERAAQSTVYEISIEKVR